MEKPSFFVYSLEREPQSPKHQGHQFWLSVTLKGSWSPTESSPSSHHRVEGPTLSGSYHLFRLITVPVSSLLDVLCDHYFRIFSMLITTWISKPLGASDWKCLPIPCGKQSCFRVLRVPDMALPPAVCVALWCVPRVASSMSPCPTRGILDVPVSRTWPPPCLRVPHVASSMSPCPTRGLLHVSVSHTWPPPCLHVPHVASSMSLCHWAEASAATCSRCFLCALHCSQFISLNSVK